MNVNLKQRTAVVIILWLLSCFQVPALDPDKKIDLYLIDQWQAVDGLPSDTILSFAQTPDGYLWIATTKGLLRFDGLTFFVVPGIQETRNLFVDREGTLWIGSAAGLISYRCRTGRFKKFSTADGLTGEGIRHIKEDMRSNLWISFDTSYVNRFSKGRFQAFDSRHGLEGKKINAILEDSRGNLLFGSSEKGIFTFRDGDFFKYSIPGLGRARINTLCEDWQGNLWIGTNEGIFRVSDSTAVKYTVKDGLTDDYIMNIIEDSHRNLWAGTKKGLIRIKQEGSGATAFESRFESITIFSLFEDREKSLWIGSDASGIRRLKDPKFSSYTPLEAYSGETPVSLFQDRQGDTWIGGPDGQLFRCRGSKVIETVQAPGLSGTGIAAIAGDAAGNLWLGTIEKGVVQKKKNGSFVRFTTDDGLADNTVTSIYADNRGSLWFCTFDGVSIRFPGGVIESFQAAGKRAHNVYEDRAGNIWIAADKGITKITKGYFYHEEHEGHEANKNKKIVAKQLDKSFAGGRGDTHRRGDDTPHLPQKPPLSRSDSEGGGAAPPEVILPGISVTCIYEDPTPPEADGPIFWIATEGAGLKRLRLRDREIFSYKAEHGMFAGSIYQFFEDSQGYFWLMSDRGILRIPKAELNRLARGEPGIVNCISFGTSDGMKSLEFDNKFSRNSALQTRGGELWFITKKGVSIVNPAQLSINKLPPPVVIEEFLFDKQSLHPYRLRPEAGANSVKGVAKTGFRFTAPTFLSPEKVKFKYRLEGLDPDWMYLSSGRERVVFYEGLSPGSYTFRVTACNADGIWNPEGAAVSFSLEPLFRQTLLFKIGLPLLVILLLAAGIYFYKKRSRKEKIKYIDSPLNPHFAEECIEKLRKLMEQDKIYREEEISVQSLAVKLSIQPYQLSQLLNDELGQSFPDLINSYRIREAGEIMLSPQGTEKNISSIAQDVGFNSLTTFYSAFKKHTGKTPKQYKADSKKK